MYRDVFLMTQIVEKPLFINVNFKIREGKNKTRHGNKTSNLDFQSAAIHLAKEAKPNFIVSDIFTALLHEKVFQGESLKNVR